MFGCVCLCCAQFVVRKRALDGNLDNYLCCQGYYPSEFRRALTMVTSFAYFRPVLPVSGLFFSRFCLAPLYLLLQASPFLPIFDLFGLFSACFFAVFCFRPVLPAADFACFAYFRPVSPVFFCGPYCGLCLFCLFSPSCCLTFRPILPFPPCIPEAGLACFACVLSTCFLACVCVAFCCRFCQ